MRVLFPVFLGLAVSVSWGDVAARQQAPRVDYTSRQISTVRYLKVSNPGEDDRLGIGHALVGATLAMSADGNTPAVSAPHEDSGATGVNGNQRDESAWDMFSCTPPATSGRSMPA